MAKERLEQMCFVGITERFAESLKLLCHTFHWPVPNEIQSQNTNLERITQKLIDAKDIKLLRRKSEADYELYEFAKAFFEKRMARAKLFSPTFDSFVSYAQNYEDVMLNRAMNGVERGFYIDVGAHDPIGGSVTRAFYERGWRGINIEPIPELCQRLLDDRPEDINLQVAASGKAGSLAFFDIPGTGLSTVKKNIADTHKRQGFDVRKIKVQAKTLGRICEEAGVSEIYSLKIDVEGAEKDVLTGCDFARYRPWIILSEATEPNSKNQNHQQWESLLVSNGYEFVYFDGLNRFYVSHEHRDLSDAFRVPPNNFDRFVKYGDLLRERQLLELHANARKLKARDDFEPQALEADRLCAEYRAVCEARAVEQEEATKQIKELTVGATSADAYAKSVVEARALEHDEAIKQIRALTESTTSGMTYAKSLVVELDSSRLASQHEREARESERRRVELETAKTDQLAKLLDALHAERAASENEQLEAEKRFLLLQTMLIAADASNKFLSEGLANLSAEVHAERTSRKVQEADSTKHMFVLGEQHSVTDANLKSQIMETERANEELAAERAKRESQQIEAHHQNIELARKLSAAVANVNASTVEIERLRQELTVERAKQVALRQDMEEQIRLLTENKGAASAHADMQAAQIDRLATDLQNVHGKLEAGRKETVEKTRVLRARIEDLELENNALWTELKTMRMEFHAARTGHNSQLIAFDRKLAAAQKDLSAYHEHWVFKVLPRPKSS